VGREDQAVAAFSRALLANEKELIALRELR